MRKSFSTFQFLLKIKKSETQFSKRKQLYKHRKFLAPNQIGKLFFKLKKFWKNIKNQLPEAEIHIYGAYATEKVFQLHNQKEGFIIKGRAENVETAFSQGKSSHSHQFLSELELKGNC